MYTHLQCLHTLQRSYYLVSTHLHRTAAHCNTLQHTATHCSTLSDLRMHRAQTGANNESFRRKREKEREQGNEIARDREREKKRETAGESERVRDVRKKERERESKKERERARRRKLCVLPAGLFTDCNPKPYTLHPAAYTLDLNPPQRRSH